MATHSSVLAWRIPGTGEPGGLPSMGSHRLGHDWSDLAAAAAAAITWKTTSTQSNPKRPFFLPKSYFSWFVILSWTRTSIQGNWCDGALWPALPVVFPLHPWAPCHQEQPHRLQHMVWLDLPPEKPRAIGGPWEESHSYVGFMMLLAIAREEAPGLLIFAYLGINLPS